MGGREAYTRLRWHPAAETLSMDKIFIRYPELREILDEVIKESQQLLRPAEQVILDDTDLQKILKCSKRTTADMRARRAITYYKPEGKIFYLLSDVFVFLTKNRVAAIEESRRL